MATQLESVQEYVGAARWFGGKGRPFRVTDIRRLGSVGDPDAEPRVVVDLVEVTYDDEAGGTELYQMPLALYAEPEGRLDHAFVGWWNEGEEAADVDDEEWVHAYDGVHDRPAMACFLAAFIDESASGDGLETLAAQAPRPPAGALRFHNTGDHELDPTAESSPFAGEQSNSSVMFGEDAMLKVFRKVTPGENPDITTHRVLTEADSPHVAHLYGWLEAGDLHLAMLQQFLRTASDGWDLAVASVRDLFAEADSDLEAGQLGGDFASEAARLGEALSEVHAQLRTAFPTGSTDAGDLAAAMHARLDAALDVVPGLAEHADHLRATFDGLAGVGEIPVQRIHADLHLGQTLRTVVGWKLVDFEGEPAKPLAERLEPDSPWRDVAGMLRSFDYAPHAVAESQPAEEPELEAHRRRRSVEWAERNQQAFLAAYAATAGEPTEADRAVLAAYVADKTVYECVYEARNRPNWLLIPLSAVARAAAGDAREE